MSLVMTVILLLSLSLLLLHPLDHDLHIVREVTLCGHLPKRCLHAMRAIHFWVSHCGLNLPVCVCVCILDPLGRG